MIKIRTSSFEVSFWVAFKIERPVRVLKTKLEGLFKAVEEVSKDKYDMVLAKNATLFVTNEFDITEQVVEKYKKSYSNN